MTNTVNTITGSLNGKFDLDIKQFDYLPIQLTTPFITTIPASISVNSTNKMDGIAKVQLPGNSDLEASLSPRIASILPSEILVKSSNSMDILTDIEPLPYTVFEFPIIKDSALLSSNPTINYGLEEEMLIGILGDSEYRAILNFYISNLPWNNSDYEYIKAELCINSINTVNLNTSLYSVENDWDEYGVTWSNQPQINSKLSDTIVGTNVGINTIDITDYLKNHEGNVSLLLKTIEKGTISRLSTKEYGLDIPTIKVYFKQNVIYNLGRNKLISNITIRRSESNVIPCAIDVNSNNLVSSLSTSITVPLYDEYNALPCNIKVSIKNINNLPLSIIVPKVEYKSDIHCIVDIRERNDIHCTINIPQYHDQNNLPCSLEVSKYETNFELPCSIDVFLGSLLPCSISIVPSNNTVYSDVPINISIPYNPEIYLACSIEVPSYNDNSNIPVQISSFMHACLPCSISVYISDYSEIPSAIAVKVKQVSDLPVAINIKHNSSLSTILDVYQHSNLSVTIDIYKKLGLSYAFIM